MNWAMGEGSTSCSGGWQVEKGICTCQIGALFYASCPCGLPNIGVSQVRRQGRGLRGLWVEFWLSGIKPTRVNRCCTEYWHDTTSDDVRKGVGRGDKENVADEE